jgi:hypothetical protein
VLDPSKISNIYIVTCATVSVQLTYKNLLGLSFAIFKACSSVSKAEWEQLHIQNKHNVRNYSLNYYSKTP